MFEAIQSFVGALPPLLQIVLGGIVSLGILFVATKIADWNDDREKKN